MDYYTLLKLTHIVGFILIGSGLLAVFVAELRAYRTSDVHRFAEAAWYTATFYDALVVPGAVLVALSGVLLILELGVGFFAEPWVFGMWVLFLFEFVEGNTITRLQFRRTLKRSRAALATGALSDADREDARTVLGQVTHFLDLPLFLAIVYCGVIRPESWGHVIAVAVVAVAAGGVLAVVVPRLVKPADRDRRH